MTTTSIVGRIVADSTGYARVQLDRALARGDNDCRIVVHRTPSKEHDDEGKEFYKVP